MITLISSDIGHRTSGQSRFTINLAHGLRQLGLEVRICAAETIPGAREDLESDGIQVSSLGLKTTSPLHLSGLMTRLTKFGERLGRLAREGRGSEWYVVTSDSAISAIRSLGNSSTAFIAQGDLALMFANPCFYNTGRVVKSVLSIDMAGLLRRNANLAKGYTALLSNSNFTRGFMSYLYGIPFTGVVYPPVDTERFKPDPTGGRAGLLSVLRNNNEPGFRAVETLASSVRVKVAGGATVRAATNLGELPDEALANEYRASACLVFPSPSEFYGYPIAEALASGTPVLSLRCGGPEELITPGVDGWLVEDVGGIVRTAETILSDGYPPSFNLSARSKSQRFSIRASALALVRHLKLGA